MRRSIIRTLIEIGGEVVALSILAGVAIAFIGNRSQWNTSIQYSNAYFIAGSLIIIAGASSRLGAGQEWTTFQRLYTESFRNMSNTERANFIVTVSSSIRTLIVGTASGMLLILISVLVTKLF